LKKNLILNLIDPFTRFIKTNEFKNFLISFTKKNNSNELLKVKRKKSISATSPILNEESPMFKKNWSLDRKKNNESLPKIYF